MTRSFTPLLVVALLAIVPSQVSGRFIPPSKKPLQATNLKVEAVEKVEKKDLPPQNPNGTYPNYPSDGPCPTKPYNASCHGKEVYTKKFLEPPTGTAKLNGTQPAQAAPAVPADVAGMETPDVANGEIPTAGEAVGQQTGVDVPNPYQYVGAIVGGGIAGTLVIIAIFCVASYYVYTWNKDIVGAGKATTCGWKSVLCCLCCTPISCCFQIDEADSWPAKSGGAAAAAAPRPAPAAPAPATTAE